MQEDERIDDRIILPQNVTKIYISDFLLVTYVLHSGVNAVFVDNSPYKKRFPHTPESLKTCVELLQQSLLIDHWMHDCWLYAFTLHGTRPSLMSGDIKKSIQYTQDLLSAYEQTDTFLISTRP